MTYEKNVAEAVTALDTSVIVPALLDRHAHHKAALPPVQAALDGDAVLPLPALLEAYAVLTRLPPAWRLRPSDAFELLSRTFRGRARIAGLEAEDGWPLLEGSAMSSIEGGAIYDAHILLCAQKAGAEILVTFNRRHFERFDLGGLRLLIP